MINTQGMDGGMEKQKEAEKDQESDTVVDGVRGQNADALVSQQKAADNHKYHTLGYQKKKAKGRLVATLGKGSSNIKTRGAPIQGLFSPGPSEKTPMQEERSGVVGSQSQVEALMQTLQMFPVPDELTWWWGEGDKAEVIENSWTDIVHSHMTMAKTQKHQQEAIWEFLYTELIYINKLTIITDLVLAALEYVHQQGFLHEITSAKLFSNIACIVDAHRHFWLEVMCPMLQKVRLTGQPFDPLQLEPGCLQFADRFSAYLDYCWEEEKNLDFTRRQMEINPQFNIFLMWVETHPQCGRMRLGDMQAKPHQRITKYLLLLKAIRKATQDLHTQQTLNRMINSVSQFLDSINDYLLFKDDEVALSDLSQKIEGYELLGMSEEIDKHIQETCRFDLTSPIRGMGPKVIRKLIMDENLKVRGRKDSKLEVLVLLFTDVLLLTKTQKKSDKLKVVRPPLSLDRIHCAELKDSYSFVLVEVSDLGCPVSIYSVSTPSLERCAAWISTIHQAQEDLVSLRTMETIKPEEPSDELLEESDPFPPAIAEEPTEYESNFASLRFTALHLETDEQDLKNQHVSAHLLSNKIYNADKEFDNDHNTTQKTEGKERSKNGHYDSDIFYGPVIERRVTWNHKEKSVKDPSVIPHQELLETKKSNGPYDLLVSELKENHALGQSSSRQFLLPSKFVPVESTITEQPSQKPVLRQDSGSHKSGDESVSLSESWTFTRKLKSPRLRRKRPVNAQPSVTSQGPRRMSLGEEPSTSFSKRNSVSDSNGNHNVFRPSKTSSKPQEHLVLKMGSVKQNRGVFWNIPAETSSESEYELPQEKNEQNSQKMRKLKAQRSESLPDLQSSTLQGLLNRAKERERERGISKREVKHFVKTYPQSFNTEREKEVAEEQEHEMYRSHRGTECSLDSSDNDRNNRPVTPLGVNVDWPGWCFDDEDVLEFTGFDDETVEGFDQTLTTTDFQKSPKNNDADYSEV